MNALITNKDSFYYKQTVRAVNVNEKDVFYNYRCLVTTSGGLEQWVPFSEWELQLLSTDNE